ncbi:hypothetical protein Rumeso_00156 [Rubellimicrobium mesophilum DSM 19309]|uniref:TPR repeat protein n=1 Tax=Rubellimicrobium mesophilum DSM 19309 TaxID=442562 RepID=A0A017HUY9_9RHOB|nr:tetratricopeptide repeat protein [Rubellimicrobium mesophilum]EYD78327.1 hypothetical protein Rumeso_00156 [Rubellimicrobium mesophilum DSM 19309]
MRGPLLTLALALWAGAAHSQVVTDAAGLREISARLLAQGQPAEARNMAEALLRRDPEDVTALLLLSRAAIEMGETREGLDAARRAHGLSDGTQRFLASRLIAKAYFDLGQDTLAQFWLRRARSDAPNAEALAALERDYRSVRAHNPLSVSLSFGIAPSSNVNGGTSADVVWLYIPTFGGYLPTIPVGDALPLSGLRVSGGATLSYRIATGERSATFLETAVNGTTYVLSDEAKRTAPDAEGSDYADLAFSESLVHRWQAEGATGPSALRATVGRTWYGGEPYTRFAQLGYDRSFVLDEDDRLSLSVFADWTERRQELSGGEVDLDRTRSIGLRGRWTHLREGGDRFNVSLGARDYLNELPDTTYSGVTAGTGYDWAEPILGVHLGLGAEIDWRRFDESFLAPEGRDDLRGTLRATMGLPGLEVWGFEPTVTIEASRTESDADRIDRNALSLDLGFESTF